MDRRVDLLIAVIWAAAGVFILVVAQGIKSIGPVVDPLGPKAIPDVVGIGLLVGGALLAVRRVRAWDTGTGNLVESDGEPDEPNIPASAPQAFALMALTFGWVIAMPYLGYVIVTLLFVILGLRITRLRSWPLAITIAVAYTAITYLVFARVVNVNFPLGPVTELFRSLNLAR
jgi:putative tricarboxylic transport membrane protein